MPSLKALVDRAILENDEVALARLRLVVHLPPEKVERRRAQLLRKKQKR